MTNKKEKVELKEASATGKHIHWRIQAWTLASKAARKELKATGPRGGRRRYPGEEDLRHEHQGSPPEAPSGGLRGGAKD